MLFYNTGNLLESKTQALVNTVNTVGIMGKGIALQFKKEFPNNHKIYVKACKENKFNIGDLLITEENSLLFGNKIIINFPTKTNWRKPSEYSYIETGLIQLAKIIEQKGIKSIALPPLGAGNGGLNWAIVKQLIEKHLNKLNCEICVYEPNNAIKELLNKERVKLTPARAMLLEVLYDLVKSGEFVSEFAAEKVAYFLQKFGAKEAFNLDFKPNFYGPYSGKVKHVLYYLNGSYINGYVSKDKKPFEEIGLIMDAEKEVMNYLQQSENKKYLEISEKTKKFLNGFYSSFGLELLSTIDFIINEKKTSTVEDITEHLNQWSDRKKTMFTNPSYIEIALSNINDFKV